MNERVSVIVPIYQVEDYLQRAVDSILHQTYDNLEVILVDDGSKDRCGEICDDYAKKDNRIVVIHKENGGLSDARNAGLDVATGDYIVFVDSDDYLAVDFVETLLNAAKEHDADVAMCSYAVTEREDFDAEIFDVAAYEKGLRKGFCADLHEANGEVEICDRQQLLTNLYDANHRDATYFIVAWNKLYKASLWEKIRFPKGKIHEDEATTYRIYDHAKKGVYLHKPMYGYFSMQGSITRAKFSLKRLDWFEALDHRIAYFEKQLFDLEKQMSDSEKTDIKFDSDQEKEFLKKQVADAKHARAYGAIHYYYPLKETMPAQKTAAKQLKGYVYSQWKEEKALSFLIFSVSAPIYRLLSNIDRDKKERWYQLAFVCLFAWLMFLCFYKLDVKYVDPWDEARHGVNAYEMLKQGNLIKSTYMYETDYYNLKPPMSMWTIILSLLVFGKNVFALRLPSVLCYLATAFVTASFLRKRYGRISALICLAFLAANTTPFIAHMVRAGDADSLYVMLFTFAMISMLQIRENPNKLYWCGFFFSCAFLTKSFHAMLIVVIGGLFLLLTGELKRIKLRGYLKFVASFVLPIGLWGIARLIADGTNFFYLMWLTDVRGRTGEGFGSNEAGFGYYFSYYLGKMSGTTQIYTVVLIAIMICAVILIAFGVANRVLLKSKVEPKIESEIKSKPGVKIGDSQVYRDTLGFALWILVPALAFSAVRTKLLWYQYPAITALLIAGAVLFGMVAKHKKMPVVLRTVAVFCAFAIAFYYSKSLFGTFRTYGVNGVQTNDFQLLLRECGNITASGNIVESGENAASAASELNGISNHDEIKAYFALQTESPEYPIEANWSQQDVYLAEVYGDYICVNGGFEKMLSELDYAEKSDVRRIIFTSQELYEMNRQAMVDAGVETQVVATRGEYIAALLH